MRGTLEGGDGAAGEHNRMAARHSRLAASGAPKRLRKGLVPLHVGGAAAGPQMEQVGNHSVSH